MRLRSDSTGMPADRAKGEADRGGEAEAEPEQRCALCGTACADVLHAMECVAAGEQEEKAGAAKEERHTAEVTVALEEDRTSQEGSG